MENEKQEIFDTSELEKKINFYEKYAGRFIIFGAVIFVFGIIVFLIPHDYHDKFGAFGEFFGGIIGAIWSLAGIFLFYSALKNQSKEFGIQKNQLDLQREELKLQRNELKLQRYETELQRKEFEELNQMG